MFSGNANRLTWAKKSHPLHPVVYQHLVNISFNQQQKNRQFFQPKLLFLLTQSLFERTYCKSDVNDFDCGRKALNGMI